MNLQWTTLVQAEVLASVLDDEDIVVVDCRHSLADPEHGVTEFARGHVPGAVHAHMDRDLSAPAAPGRGAGRHPWPPASQLCARLGAWGITTHHQVVAYDGGDGAFAARLWFLLRALGHARVAVLDGGWARWRGLGLPVETALRNPAPARYVAEFDPSQLLGADQVQAHLEAGGLLLDARAAERFRGEIEPIDRVGGHVPGATNRPFTENMGADGHLREPGQLREDFLALMDGREAEQVAVMCGSGVTACHHLLAMAHAGLPGARLYTGSWSGWIEAGSRPVAVGP
ncbi:sulfurtransferase [Luteimonas sp. A277]